MADPDSLEIPDPAPSPRRQRSIWTWIVPGLAVVIVGLTGVVIAVGGLNGLADLISPVPVEVTGTVMFKGKPVTDGYLQTYPDRRLMGALGSIASDGTFRLLTNGDPGAYPGTHKVVVMWMDNSNPPKHLLPDKYTSPQTTPLILRVQPSVATHVRFDLDDSP